MDTIFALATAQGRAGVAVIRLSGPRAHAVAEQLAGPGLVPRGMAARTLRDRSGDVLDDAVILTFAGPASFTGEDVAELQVHGSAAVVANILGVLSGIDGLRLADPGEFTRRALENGRLDLAQVEGLADLLEPSISVEEVGVFKTDFRVYERVGARFGVAPDAVSFQSSNRWDIAGAAKFGFRAVWINRSKAPDEYRDMPPAAVLDGLAGLLHL